MSDPKPLRFTVPESEVRSPSWLPPRNGTSDPPRSLQPPRVEVESIRGAAQGAESPAARPVDWAPRVANLNGRATAQEPQPVADDGRVGELEQALREAQAEAQALREQLDEAVREAQAAREEFVRAATDLAGARAETMAAIETQLLELSVLVAQSIIEDEVANRPELHKVLVEAALEHLGGEGKAGLRCSPAAYDLIVECLGGTHVEVAGVTVVVTVDRELKGLGCVVEGDNRRVDGRVTERLAAVRRAFLAENRRKQEEGP